MQNLISGLETNSRDDALTRKITPEDTFPTVFTLGKDAFPDRASAIADAEKRRDRRIEALKRQIEAIKTKTFFIRPGPGKGDPNRVSPSPKRHRAPRERGRLEAS